VQLNHHLLHVTYASTLALGEHALQTLHWVLEISASIVVALMFGLAQLPSSALLTKAMIMT
jgi:hypothetical protein